jgi:colanic acid/amylovoran biosynthesis glycosyltransferase
MKVAFFISSFPTLSETFILSQITGLLDRGVHVDIFARGSGRDQVMHPDIANYNLEKRTFYYGQAHQQKPKNITFRLLKLLPILVKSIGKDFLTLIRALNIFTYGRKSRNLSLFYTAHRLKSLHIETYDVIHCHFGDMGREVLLFKNLRLIKGKLITTFYGWDCSSYVKTNGEKIYDELFHGGDLFLCLSEEMKQRLIAIGCPRDKIVIHHLGIDTNKFKPLDSKNNKNGTIKILTVGRLVEKKGIEYAIRAVAKLKKAYPELKYSIIGDGPLREKLENLVFQLGVSDHVYFLGPKNRSDIISEMSRSDLFIAPSVTSSDGDMEGTPTVLMEAQALELPVLSTLHSGIPEVVADGRSGFLVPERDVDALVEMLMHLLDQRTDWKTMGSLGRRHVAKEFSTDILSKKLEDIYAKL